MLSSFSDSIPILFQNSWQILMHILVYFSEVTNIYTIYGLKLLQKTRILMYIQSKKVSRALLILHVVEEVLIVEAFAKKDSTVSFITPPVKTPKK